MGFARMFALLVVVLAFSIALISHYCPEVTEFDPQPPEIPNQYFGRGKVPENADNFPKDDPAIKKFTIRVEDKVLKDLDARLNNTRYVEPLDNVQFQYGFHANYLKEVIQYWRTKYDWRKQEKELNKFSHFKTQIEGIDVHFIHQKPKVKSGDKIRVFPLLLVHGWPGSVAEFQKIIPILTTPRKDRDYVFEVICPSIPGYGFSEAPHQPGFSSISAARVFLKLMDRLGYPKFYTQGGDWGSLITSNMARLYPDRIIGLHLNMAAGKTGFYSTMKYLAAYFFPSLFTSEEERAHIISPTELVSFLMQETGYAHIQATKPDTIGTGLNDSPAGLAAYILEKFSTWTDPANRELPDGGLTSKFTLDELLTNVMIYWTTNSIASSTRFYKEQFSAQTRSFNLERVPVKVPTGFAMFPHELLNFPRCVLQTYYWNIVRFSRMPRGGHFPAMEEPGLLAEDIWDFALDVQNYQISQEKAKS